MILSACHFVAHSWEPFLFLNKRSLFLLPMCDFFVVVIIVVPFVLVLLCPGSQVPGNPSGYTPPWTQIFTIQQSVSTESNASPGKLALPLS